MRKNKKSIVQETKPKDIFKDTNHKTTVLNKEQVKQRNAANKDYSKDLNRTVGGGRHRVYLGKNATDRKGTVKRIWRYLDNYRSVFILVMITMGLATILGGFLPYLFAQAIDKFIVFDYSAAYTVGAYIIIFALLNSIIRFIGRYSMTIISQKTVARIRKDAFDRLQLLPVKYYDDNLSGDIVSRITNDVDLISAVLSQFVLELINSSIMLVFSLFMMFFINWGLALIVIIFVPFMAIFTMKIGKITRKGFVAQQKFLGALNGIVEENTTGLKVVKLYGTENEVLEEFIETNTKLRDAGYKAQVYSGFIMPVIMFLQNFIYVIVVAIGGLLKISGKIAISIGDISAITQYTRSFIQPISNLAQLFNTLQQGLAGAERVFTLIDEPNEYVNDGEIEAEHLKGHIEFKNVTFGYVPDKIVLKDISFNAEAGKTIAIVGPTGSGKTTIINLLNRFYDVNEGEILIDETNITTYKKDSVRKNIGVVLQDTSLFSGTVRENIMYGKLDATDKEMVHASTLANANDFIERLPQGYDTEVFEGGNNFSQGERQLISIARTILSDPDVLILDEATSNVDTRTEFKIQESMRTLMKNRTSFVIAHRLQTIRNASKILVIKDGELIESGNHHDLLHLGGFYYDLYTTQFKDLVIE
ncbi:ABC transporter ATP-binding protein/permease [Candidatus Izimaplasma bacterium]|nr:ABC transporter ATP-binding protein/permease [Candidatus Izimaplasma bacterium]